MSAKTIFAVAAVEGTSVPEGEQMLAFAKRGEEVKVQIGGVVPPELGEKYRVYIVSKEPCSFRYAVNSLIKCTKPNGSEFTPGANGMMTLQMRNPRGLRRLMEVLKWPDQVTFGDVYCALKPEVENRLRSKVAAAGPKGLRPYEEWLNVIPASPELNRQAYDDAVLLFDQFGIRLLKDSFTIEGLAPVLAE